MAYHSPMARQFAALTLLLLAGCADRSGWHRTGMTDDAARTAEYDCQRQAVRQAGADAATRSARDTLFEGCMRAQGWRR